MLDEYQASGVPLLDARRDIAATVVGVLQHQIICSTLADTVSMPDEDLYRRRMPIDSRSRWNSRKYYGDDRNLAFGEILSGHIVGHADSLFTALADRGHRYYETWQALAETIGALDEQARRKARIGSAQAYVCGGLQGPIQNVGRALVEVRRQIFESASDRSDSIRALTASQSSLQTMILNSTTTLSTVAMLRRSDFQPRWGYVGMGQSVYLAGLKIPLRHTDSGHLREDVLTVVADGDPPSRLALQFHRPENALSGRCTGMNALPITDPIEQAAIAAGMWKVHQAVRGAATDARTHSVDAIDSMHGLTYLAARVAPKTVFRDVPVSEDLLDLIVRRSG
jgi:hypothetical protein